MQCSQHCMINGAESMLAAGAMLSAVCQQLLRSLHACLLLIATAACAHHRHNSDVAPLAQAANLRLQGCTQRCRPSPCICLRCLRAFDLFRMPSSTTATPALADTTTNTACTRTRPPYSERYYQHYMHIHHPGRNSHRPPTTTGIYTATDPICPQPEQTTQALPEPDCTRA